VPDHGLRALPIPGAEVKEIKFRPKVDEHDYQFKKKHIERFLEDGDKVKATIFFRGREMAHPEIGRRILERLIEDLTQVAIAETAPRQEGNQMHTILSARAGAKRTAPKPVREAAPASLSEREVAAPASLSEREVAAPVSLSEREAAAPAPASESTPKE
jgi:translation initiation factor IF-3